MSGLRGELRPLLVPCLVSCCAQSGTIGRCHEIMRRSRMCYKACLTQVLVPAVCWSVFPISLQLSLTLGQAAPNQTSSLRVQTPIQPPSPSRHPIAIQTSPMQWHRAASLNADRAPGCLSGRARSALTSRPRPSSAAGGAPAEVPPDTVTAHAEHGNGTGVASQDRPTRATPEGSVSVRYRAERPQRVRLPLVHYQ